MPLTAALQARLKKRGILAGEGAGEKRVKGCPNQWNQYHKCSDYCAKRWGSQPQEEEEEEGSYQGTLVLPPGWKKVIDEDTKHPYFWNVKTNEVSWHPPSGSITKDLRQPSVDESQKKQVLVERPSSRDKHRPAPYIKRRPRYNKVVEELDPMDPAAYSDTPRGTWSTGLDRRGEAKTGVDVTANGPLYQMRPYPSPGDILRANKKLADD